MARNIEDENLISTLYEQINKLQGQNTELQAKNKKLVDLLEKRKKQVVNLERQVNDQKRRDVQRPGGRKTTSLPDVDIVAARTSLQTESHGYHEPLDSMPHTNMAEIARSLKNRY